MKPLYTIAIACFNQIEYTERCIASIISHSERYRVILINNGSWDGTQEFFEKLCASDPEHFSLLDMKGNAGFIAAQNKALEFSATPYHVVLNNDVTVCPGWLESMRAHFLANPRIGLVGIKGMCNALDATGKGIVGPALEFVEACCMMAPTWLLKRHGLFSTYLRRGYAEDSDLSLRMRERGYEIAAANIPVIHHRAVTAKAVGPSIDMPGFHALNHAVLRDRWRDYFKRHSFEKRITIKRRGARGDVLMLTPVIRAMKHRWAHAKISVITDHPEIFRGNPDVSPLTREPADLTIDLDLCYERKPWLHVIDAYAQACGVECQDWRLRVYPNASERQAAAGWMSRSGRWVVVHPGPLSWASRNWQRTRWENLGEYLIGSGWNVLLVGDGNAYEIPCTLDMRGMQTFHGLAACIERASAFIGLDSLPMHLAQAANVPTVGLFGAIDPKLRLLPWRHCVGVTAAEADCGCLGCHHKFDAPRESSKCLRDRLVCMEGITVQMVIDALTLATENHRVQQETSKIRPFIAHLLEGKGIDLGCFRDKIAPDAVGFDDDDYPEVNVKGDASGPLPFADGEFDYVYSSHALEDMADTEGVLREWTRILKPGGHLVLYVPHPVLYTGVNLDHVHPGFTPDDLRPIIAAVGCVVCDEFVHSGPDRYSSLIIARKA